MRYNTKAMPKIVPKTRGIGSFGEGVEEKASHRLFRVEPGHDGDYAIEQALLMIHCAYKLTGEASIEPSESKVSAAHWITGMAKALLDDIAHGLLMSPSTSSGEVPASRT